VALIERAIVTIIQVSFEFLVRMLHILNIRFTSLKIILRAISPAMLEFEILHLGSELE